MKIVLFSRRDPGTMSTLKRDRDLKCAIESQAEIGGRILEFIDAHLAGSISDVPQPVEVVA